MSASKVIEIARGELGNTESPPGSNRVKYWEAFSSGWQGQPWCLAFIYWCFRESGELLAFMGGGKTASCGTLLRWYQAQGQTVPVSEVRPGDIVILNFMGTKDTQHCGLVTEAHWHQDATLDYVCTVEGNTSPGLEGSQDNGGCVALKRRYPSQIVAVFRPKYKEEPMQKPDYEGHWAEESIRKAITTGVLKGYEDGSFQPDKSITRAELCVILDRLGLLK